MVPKASNHLQCQSAVSSWLGNQRLELGRAIVQTTPAPHFSFIDREANFMYSTCLLTDYLPGIILVTEDILVDTIQKFLQVWCLHSAGEIDNKHK